MDGTGRDAQQMSSASESSSEWHSLLSSGLARCLLGCPETACPSTSRIGSPCNTLAVPARSDTARTVRDVSAQNARYVSAQNARYVSAQNARVVRAQHARYVSAQHARDVSAQHTAIKVTCDRIDCITVRVHGSERCDEAEQ